jgi:prephenate dehydratase
MDLPARTTILLTSEDRPGALAELLATFKKHDINLTHIESRPSRIVCCYI